MPNSPFQVAGISKIAGWTDSGSLYAGQIRTVHPPGGAPFEVMIAQGGLTFTPPPGDPLSVWIRRAGEQAFTLQTIPVNPPYPSPRHFIISRDWPGLFPHLLYSTFDPNAFIGSTAAGGWYLDENGRAQIFFCPTISDVRDPNSHYLRNFVLQHAESDDFQNARRVSYNRDHPNIAVRDTALYFGQFPQPVADPNAAFGIGGACPLPVPSEGQLYVMLKLFTERFGGKNVLVRRPLTGDSWSTFEVCIDTAAGTFVKCSGELPDAVTQSDWTRGNCFMWPIDSIYETPAPWRSRGRFVGLTGQPADPQLALIFSDNLFQWPDLEKIDLGRSFANLNYRFMNPETRAITFASNEGKDVGGNPNAELDIYEVKPAG